LHLTRRCMLDSIIFYAESAMRSIIIRGSARPDTNMYVYALQRRPIATGITNTLKLNRTEQHSQLALDADTYLF
jgi:hypothetical protein